MEKEKESLRDQLTKLKQLGDKHQDYVDKFKSEMATLNAIINEADQEQQRQKKECEMVVNERDILGTQLIRRNEELALLYEKIRIQESTLHKGAQQFALRHREALQLSTNIRELQAALFPPP